MKVARVHIYRSLGKSPAPPLDDSPAGANPRIGKAMHRAHMVHKFRK